MSDAPLDEDALSGRKFVRWNLGALLVALAALGAGAWIQVNGRAAAPASPPAIPGSETPPR